MDNSRIEKQRSDQDAEAEKARGEVDDPNPRVRRAARERLGYHRFIVASPQRLEDARKDLLAVHKEADAAGESAYRVAYDAVMQPKIAAPTAELAN